MKVLVTGSGGQLGHDLIATVPDTVELVAMDRASLDICDAAAVAQVIDTVRPQLVINAAAYTAVDLAETEEAAAHAINAVGPANIAQSCLTAGSRLIHLSTDYVFDGLANTPYQASYPTAPQSAYGRSKLAGEVAVLGHADLAVSVVRASWLYGSRGGNFVKTMLRLMNERSELGVVVDQVGTPTWTRPLAHMLWKMAQREDLTGVWHWSDLGVASWFDFARAIYQAGIASGRLTKEVNVKPISSSAFPTPAKRPAYSVLDPTALRDALELPGGYWRDHVFEFIESAIDE